VYLACLIIIVGSAFIGYFATPNRDARRTIGIAAALGNPGLALAVLATSHPDLKATAFVMAYVLFRLVVVAVFKRWADRRAGHPAGTVPEAT
jgi:predicted Na+-dependent transporter